MFPWLWRIFVLNCVLIFIGGSDYEPSYTNHTFILDMDTIESCVAFSTTDNTVLESDRDFKVTLESNDAAVNITTDQAVVNILDDDSK